jgi:hypothetical protein
VEIFVFLPSPSPGAVLRLLERRHRPPKPCEILLSDPVGSAYWRVLRVSLSEENRQWGADLPTVLTSAYSSLISVEHSAHNLKQTNTLQHGKWQITEWQSGEKHATYDEADFVKRPSLWEKIPLVSIVPKRRGGAATRALEAWAANHNTRFPASLLVSRIASPPKKMIAYETVAILDQRSLLVETEPLWYNFTLLQHEKTL